MKARGKIRSAYFAGAASWSMQPPIFCCNSSPSCVSYMQKKKRFTVLGGWYLRISSPIFIARKYITLTLRLYSCIMYVQAKPMRFYRARVFGQAPKFLPKIQALCLCRAPFAFSHFAKVGKMVQMRKGIFILWILQNRVFIFLQGGCHDSESYKFKISQNGYEIIRGARLKEFSRAIDNLNAPDIDVGSISNRTSQISLFDFKAFLNSDRAIFSYFSYGFLFHLI